MIEANIDVQSVRGLCAGQAQIHALQSFKDPKTPKEMKSFIGLVTYWHDYIKDLQIHLIPLYELAKDGTKVPNPLPDKVRREIQHLKNALATAPILRPLDPKRQLIVDTDASKWGIGAAAYREAEDGKKYINC